jgi:hypothetical protein
LPGACPQRVSVWVFGVFPTPNPRFISLLLNSPVDLFFQEELLRASLIPCIRGGYLDLVELLASKGVDVGCLPDAVSIFVS